MAGTKQRKKQSDKPKLRALRPARKLFQIERRQDN